MANQATPTPRSQRRTQGGARGHLQRRDAPGRGPDRRTGPFGDHVPAALVGPGAAARAGGDEAVTAAHDVGKVGLALIGGRRLHNPKGSKSSLGGIWERGGPVLGVKGLW